MAKLVVDRKWKSSYSGGTANFCHSSYDTWQSCRVTFHDKWYKGLTTGKGADFCYIPYHQTFKDILTLLNEVEDKLGLAADDQVSLSLVDNVCYCSPSPWWCDPIRFTLLTALIKDSRHGGYEASINDIGTIYLNKTINSVRAFVEEKRYFYHKTHYDGWCVTIGNNPATLKNAPSSQDSVLVTWHPGWPYNQINLAKR